MREYLQSLANEIKSIFNHTIETTKTYNVPGRNDTGLTFSRDQIKRGKLIETCVLFIDIRDSTKISQSLNHSKDKLGKIYSAFIHSMVTIADKYGYVRNIIGDRIMVVFEPNNCYESAIECATVMNTTASNILKQYTGLPDFKVGIGIDFGEMLILKTGVARKHDEQSEYKNLVWIGDVANVASKLTDFANKTYSATTYNLKYDTFTYGYRPLGAIPLSLLGTPKLGEKTFFSIEKEITISSEDFNKKVKIESISDFKYNGSKLKSLTKNEKTISTESILITEAVYKGIKGDSQFKKLFELKKYPDQPLNKVVYGGSIYYPTVKEISL
jgi:adenylate cyclase